MVRTLEIEVAMLVEAMTRSDEFGAELGIETGEIDLHPEDFGLEDEEDGQEPAGAAEQRVHIPRLEGSVLYRWMAEFASEIDEDDVRQQLEDALDGRGAFGRFRRAIARHPDLRAQWERRQAERVLEEARPWLASLGVMPVFRFPEPSPATAARPAPEGRIGLVELLLLGAPDGKTELLDGRVSRVFLARSASEARAVFKAVAREVCEWNGIAWRNRFIERRDTYEAGRFVVSVNDARVELLVAVSPALWHAFAGA